MTRTPIELMGSSACMREIREELAVIPGSVPNLIDLPAACRFAPRFLTRGCAAAGAWGTAMKGLPLREAAGFIQGGATQSPGNSVCCDKRARRGKKRGRAWRESPERVAPRTDARHDTQGSRRHAQLVGDGHAEVARVREGGGHPGVAPETHDWTAGPRFTLEVRGESFGDATDLDLDDSSVDAVLLLGPLYHLHRRSDRLQALREAKRIVRPGGPIFAAAISRSLASFRPTRMGSGISRPPSGNGTPPRARMARIERTRCWLSPMRPVTPFMMMPMRCVVTLPPLVLTP